MPYSLHLGQYSCLLLFLYSIQCGHCFCCDCIVMIFNTAKQNNANQPGPRYICLTCHEPIKHPPIENFSFKTLIQQMVRVEGSEHTVPASTWVAFFDWIISSALLCLKSNHQQAYMCTNSNVITAGLLFLWLLSDMIFQSTTQVLMLCVQSITVFHFKQMHWKSL